MEIGWEWPSEQVHDTEYEDELMSGSLIQPRVNNWERFRELECLGDLKSHIVSEFAMVKTKPFYCILSKGGFRGGRTGRRPPTPIFFSNTIFLL